MHRSRTAIPWLRFLFAAWLVGWATGAAAEDARGKSQELFEKHVRPTLVEHCIRCHGPEKQRAGLRLDSAQGWAEGGDSGAAIQPGDLQSLLLQAIRYEDPNIEMPPRGKLSDSTIAAFEQWVASGAIDPRDPDSQSNGTLASMPDLEAGRSFWAFQPVAPVEPPAVRQTDWPTTPIDRFILAELESRNLHVSDPADRQTLLRRVYYDLIGLPPTPAAIRDFSQDESPQALAKVVDQLLQSPRFGQRWGRHWLDVVRFAESSGGGRTLLFPDAWRYRDYVIESINRDVPYNRFLVEQLAGDLLPWQDVEQRRRNLIATGFLLLGPTNYEMQDKDVLEMDVVDEQLDTIGKAFLGMTVGCARCHDHKFDPIPATDYYAMAGIFKSTQALIHSNVSSWNTVGLPLDPDQEAQLAAQEQRLTELRKELQQAKRRLEKAGGDSRPGRTVSIAPDKINAVVLDDRDASKTGPWKESTSIAGFVGDGYIHDLGEQRGLKQVVYQHEVDQSGRYEVLVSYTPGSNRSTRVPVHVLHRDGETVIHVNQRIAPPIENAFLSIGTFSFDAGRAAHITISNSETADGVVIADSIVIYPAEKTLAQVFPDYAPAASVDQEERRQWQTQVQQIEQQLKQIEQASPKRPVSMTVQDRATVGDVHLAIRGVLGQDGPLVPRGVMQVACWEPFPPIPPECSGRQQFAEWIADARHPLTARVMANRVWYWMMGQGIVRSVDNFGSTGDRPSHPELLDYLADAFVQEGWSIKQLVRRIALSRVYQLSSAARTDCETDSANRYYWRMNRKRLRAEDIRDSILMVSGSLNDDFGGPTIKSGTKIEYGYQFDSLRRSVYLPVFRNTLPEVFEVFDFADPNIQRGQRSSSTIASQALWMMNHPTILQESRRAAERLLDQGMEEPAQGIDRVHLQVLGRLPTTEERTIALDLVQKFHDTEDPLVGWTMLYQTLFQSIDFLYLN